MIAIMGAACPVLAQTEFKITADDFRGEDRFGYDVSINGDYALVGALNVDAHGSAFGAAYVFQRVGGVWIQAAKLIPDDGASGVKFRP